MNITHRQSDLSILDHCQGSGEHKKATVNIVWKLLCLLLFVLSMKKSKWFN